MTGTSVVRALQREQGVYIGCWLIEKNGKWVKSSLRHKSENPDLDLAKFARSEYSDYNVSDIEHVDADLWIVVLTDYDDDEFVVNAQWVAL